MNLAAEQIVRDLAALLRERKRRQSEIDALDRQIECLVGIEAESRKPPKKTLSNHQFIASCGV